MITLDGKRFLVAGASSGIGAATALLLNRLGACVIAVARRADALEAVRSASAQPENFLIEPFDLTAQIAPLNAWLKAIVARTGLLDGMVHCAGVCAMVPLALVDDSHLTHTLSTNVLSAVRLAKAVLDRRHNTGKGASLVFIASTAAQHENAGLAAYAASKGAIVSLVRSLACECAPRGIRVNALSPGLIPTPQTEKLFGESLAARAALYPLGVGTPEDIAQTAAFLLSPAARWITGQNITVDGGKGLL